MKPTSETVDALLGLAGSTSTPQLATDALEMLAELTRETWRPLPEELRKKIETALVASPDAYPQPAASLALLTVGGGPAIAASAKQLLAALEKLREQSSEQAELASRVQHALLQLEGDAFPFVVRAYSELPRADDRGTLRNGMLNSYRDAVQRLASRASSLDLARSAQGLEGEKFAYYATLVARWLRERFGQGTRPGVKLEKEWLPLLSRMGASADEELRAAAAIGLGALLDASVLPDLITASNDPSGRVQSAAANAVGYVIGADRANARRVLEDAMATAVRQTGKHSTEIAGMLGRLESKDALELAERYWKESQDPWVRNALYRVVCDVDGPAALDFLLRKLPEMQASNGYARKLAVERFGSELYEPALDAMEQLLRDPDDSVRAAARGAFAAFKAQREALAEFAAWKATASEARTTIDELLKLTESPNVDVVVGAVKALGALKASAAYPKLVRLLERKEPEIKTAVQAALDKLGE
ncbi:MAG: HEAT repeat domain-containing protein [Planctomycetes bacterium]|nr:HEAT repeat domain-containing protein [Planctomycetota bacterium]